MLKFLFILLLTFIFSNCTYDMPIPKKPTADELAKYQPPINVIGKSIDGYSINYAQRDYSTQKPIILFIHGSPGTWSNWMPFLASNELSNFGTLIAVDRPGFGKSNDGKIITDLRLQAKLFSQLIPEGKKAVVVGHSLGSPIAGWMGIDYPEKICKVISIAGSLADEYEAPRWFNYLADLSLVKFFLSRDFINSNNEIFALAGELKKQKQFWQKLQVPIWIIQGEKDSLVNPKTVASITPSIPANLLKTIIYPTDGHLIIWRDPQKIITEINQVLCR